MISYTTFGVGAALVIGAHWTWLFIAKPHLRTPRPAHPPVRPTVALADVVGAPRGTMPGNSAEESDDGTPDIVGPRGAPLGGAHPGAPLGMTTSAPPAEDRLPEERRPAEHFPDEDLNEDGYQAFTGGAVLDERNPQPEERLPVRRDPGRKDTELPPVTGPTDLLPALQAIHDDQPNPEALRTLVTLSETQQRRGEVAGVATRGGVPPGGARLREALNLLESTRPGVARSGENGSHLADSGHPDPGSGAPRPSSE